MGKQFIKVSLCVMALGVGVAWASSGDWSAAKSKVEDFKQKEGELRKRAPEETRKIVAAICAASSQDKRKSEASSAASMARSTINDKYSDLEHLKRDAIDMLENVERDDKLKDQHSDASSLESDVKSRWDKIGELTHDVRNGSPPVVEWMVSHGDAAIRDHASHCDAHDVSLSYGHAACLIARGETCKVVEFAPDNSNAISSAKDLARRYQSQLEDELKKSSSDVMKHLASERSDFSKCKHFEAEVECYKQCPEISDDNRFSDASPSWRTGC
jgi:hypothetical protein